MKKPPPIEYLQHLFKEEKYDELAASARQLLIAEPENVRGLYWRACAYMRLEKMDAAQFDLDRAIDLYDEYADAFSQRGVLFFHKGNLQKALEDMNKAVSLEPDNPYRYSSRAYIKAALNEVESAITDYEKAIELDPDDAVAHNNLGLLQEQLGYKSQAQRNLEKADNLMVNEDGELVERAPIEPVLVDEQSEVDHSSYLQIIRDIFTTKDGFRNYLNFIRSKMGR